MIISHNKKPNRIIALIFFAAAIALAAGIAAPKAKAQSNPRSPGDRMDAPSDTVVTHVQMPISQDDYLIAPQDLLFIDVFDVPEFSREYRVGVDGFVSVPLLPSPIKAAGTTPRQLGSTFASELQKGNLVNDPRVTISLIESPFHTVTVTGAVSRPVSFPLPQNARVVDAITAAGGATENAGDDVQINRGSQVFASISLKRALAGDRDANLLLQPGDTVSVSTAPVFYVTGAVNHPGAFPIHDQTNHMTVLRAIALAEDSKSTAALSKAKIIRRTDSQEQTEIPVDLKKIIKGHAPDQTLSASDILFVPESSGKKAALRGAEAAVQTASGIVVFGRY